MKIPLLVLFFVIFSASNSSLIPKREADSSADKNWEKLREIGKEISEEKEEIGKEKIDERQVKISKKAHENGISERDDGKKIIKRDDGKQVIKRESKVIGGSAIEDLLEDLLEDPLEKPGQRKSNFEAPTFPNLLMRAVETRQFKGDAKEEDPLSKAKGQMTVSDWQINNCEEICKPGTKLQVPLCKKGRYVPDYHEECRCLMGYRCCPSVCAPVNAQCEEGVTMRQQGIDCCGCPTVKCISCPMRTNPVCNPRCEVLDFSSLPMSKCRVPVCKKRCPKIEDRSCPKCQKSSVVKNVSFCGCLEQVCKPAVCKETSAVLAPRPCKKVQEAVDDCGCTIRQYTEVGICTAKNNKSEKLMCKDDFLPSHCLFKSIQKDSCGCNVGQCVRKTENCVHKFPSSDVCPDGHYIKAGITPCGLDRDICLKCEDTDLDETECNSKCNSVVEERNKNGCRVQRCESKPCEVVSPKCSFCEQMIISPNECGCPTAKCIAKCPDIDRSECKGGPSHSLMSTDECGCDRVTCLPRPKEVLASSIGSYSVANSKMTWAEADRYCRTKGGNLAVVGSKAENMFVRLSNTNFKLNSTYWVGGKCSGDSGKEKCWDDYLFDVQLIIDSSGSLGKKFKPMMEVVSDFIIDILKIGPDQDRVGVVTYSTTNKIKDIALLGEINNKELLKKKVKEAKHLRGQTFTAAAMNQAFDTFKARGRNNNSTMKICVVITDGKVNDEQNIEAARTKWLKEGVLLFAIGLGNSIDKDGLIKIAGGQSRVRSIPEIDDFATICPEILNQVCRRLTAKRRFVWTVRGKEYLFTDVAYPPIDISGEDDGCTGADNGIALIGKERGRTGWTQLDVQEDADGAICEFQVENL